MMQVMKQTTISLCVLLILTGCATVQSAAPDNDERVETETSSRTKKTLLAIGGALILGAVIVNEAEDGAEEAVKDAARP